MCDLENVRTFISSSLRIIGSFNGANSDVFSVKNKTCVYIRFDYLRLNITVVTLLETYYVVKKFSCCIFNRLT